MTVAFHSTKNPGILDTAGINSTKVPRVNFVEIRLLLNPRNRKRLMRLFSFSEVVEI